MLGIIIINYNSFEKTIDCIQSVRQTYQGNYMIYLLDNHSTNESARVFKEKYEHDLDVKLILSDENHGYARGNNLCMRMAKEDGCDKVLISNNDIVYTEKSINIMENVLDKEKVLAVGPQVVKPDGLLQITIKHKKPSFLHYMIYETYARNLVPKRIYKQEIIPSMTEQVYWLCGCSFMADLEQFEEIGYFDDYTFLYFEEYIMSEKSKRAGKRMLYCPEAKVMHYHGYSMGGALNIVTRSANWQSESYFIKTYWKWNTVKRWILWNMRVLEIRFNCRHEQNKKELVRKYKEGRQYL